MSTVRAPRRRTLWEEGRHPGRLVVHAAAVVALVVVVAHLLLTDRLTWVFDAAFVLVCVSAALAVRPRDFFVIGVMPPLLMAGTMLLLAVVARSAVADPRDGVVQALVSGLAHHAGALILGYALALGVLALRQVAARNAGVIRGPARPGVPRQRDGEQSRRPAHSA
ncbi:MAG: DUF6542 domain-containing protein [Actinomycetes bacterium]